MSKPPHAFNPWIVRHLALHACTLIKVYAQGKAWMEDEGWYDVWEGTGLKDDEYFAHRNDSAPLVVAAQLGNLAEVQARLDAGDDVESCGLDGETALHMAAALGFAPIIQLLLEHRANPEKRDKEGAPPLAHYARFCPPDKAEEVGDLLLGAAGADPNAVTHDYAACVAMTPLAMAIHHRNTATARVLLPHTDLNSEAVKNKYRGDNDHLMAALYLCRLGQSPGHGDEILDLMLKQGLEVREQDVYYALEVGRWNVVERILKEAGLDDSYLKADPDRMFCYAFGDAYYRDFPFVDVARRFFKDYGTNVNDPRVQRAIIIRYGQKGLFDAALEAGLDLTTISKRYLRELSCPGLDPEWARFVSDHRNRQEAEKEERERSTSSSTQ